VVATERRKVVVAAVIRWLIAGGQTGRWAVVAGALGSGATRFAGGAEKVRMSRVALRA